MRKLEVELERMGKDGKGVDEEEGGEYWSSKGWVCR